jgi:hypothetical protein
MITYFETNNILVEQGDAWVYVSRHNDEQEIILCDLDAVEFLSGLMAATNPEAYCNAVIDKV